MSTKIFLRGKDITEKIIGWRIWQANNDDRLKLTVTYRSQKEFTCDFNEYNVIPTLCMANKFVTVKKTLKTSLASEVVIVADRYVLVRYSESNEKQYLMNFNNVEISECTNLLNEDIFRYFVDVAKERVAEAKNQKDHNIAQNVLKQIQDVTPISGSALNSYCYQKVNKRKQYKDLIFPFGLNESQLSAVNNAFSSQISVIEGPPGTGKTQTILNIIANILVNKHTVAIVSNNNDAVKNVYEKMEKVGLDYLIAKLGSGLNRTAFFEKQKKAVKERLNEEVSLESISLIFQQLRKSLNAKNELAKNIALRDEINVEKQYIENLFSKGLITELLDVSKYKISSEKMTDLIVYLDNLEKQKLSFKNKIHVLFNYRLIQNRFLDDLDTRSLFCFSLQYYYYEVRLQECNKIIQRLENFLLNNEYDRLLSELTQKSMLYLKQYLSNQKNKDITFGGREYKNNFSEFIKRYPIIGSGTHSICNSIPKGYMFDFVIVDESSQQDIIPGILNMACAKNIIIVGDNKQLPHIPAVSKITCPAEDYDCTKYSFLDSVTRIFKEKVPITLLKEHYRCHPKIINFCNIEYYNGELIPMTEDKGERSLSLIRTSKGNHTRNFSNLREIESIDEVGIKFLDDIAFITPYNNQVSLAKTFFEDDFIASTVHKFQGRECREVVFSTILDKKRSSQHRLNFVDNPCLVNVAVSRAKDKFTLVTGDGVFEENNKSIASLIRYIEYYAKTEDIYNAPVISAFDLLYSDYDKSLEKLNSRLKKSDSKYKSEQIATQIVREALERNNLNQVEIHREVTLELMVNKDVITFSEQENQFMKNRGRCDIVIYYKQGKKAAGVIEVDGSSHEKPEQAYRDRLKNSILEKATIPLLRIKTIEAHVEQKIEEFILNCV